MFKTKNYDQFNIIKGNRGLNKTNLRNLEKSILENNMLDKNPILVNEDYFIIDGQHRLEVARRHGLDIYYIVAQATGLREVHILNTNQKAWTVSDYVSSYIELGDHDYKTLSSFVRQYKLPLTVSAGLLEGSNFRRSVVDKIKTGEFKIKNLERASEIAEELAEIKPYVEGEIWRTRDFIEAFLIATKDVSSKKLIKKFRGYKHKLGRKASVKEYLRAFEDLYNYRAKNNEIRFYQSKSKMYSGQDALEFL